jgi:rhamnulokinase
VANTTRLLKNIAGMWLVQECRRIWARDGHPYDWGQLVEMAQHAEPLAAIFDPEDPRLTNPPNMPETIQQLCGEGTRGVPQTHGAIIRAALESLAVRYREVLKTLEQLTGSQIKTIHIVGGGSQNELLSQMTADATGRVTMTGPVEATAIGNALQQAIAAGLLGSVADAREVVRASFELKSYHPRETNRWDEIVLSR